MNHNIYSLGNIVTFIIQGEFLHAGTLNDIMKTAGNYSF